MTRARTGVNGGKHAPAQGCAHCEDRTLPGTFIPARLAPLAPGLEAQALREAAARLLRCADRSDHRRSRVTFLASAGGQCGVCQGYFEGDRCPDCAPRGRA